LTRRWLRIAALAALLVAVGLAGTWVAPPLRHRRPLAGRDRHHRGANVIPLTYFLKIVRGIVLKGVGLDLLLPSLLPSPSSVASSSPRRSCASASSSIDHGWTSVA
jgi:hypothetical protein